ncbi:MAG TPA: hypothetical protein VMH39_02730 [Gemmatimonadaceae bacterium]|nr:hypothetical protein [Gemmatimonadaceae bacterium]
MRTYLAVTGTLFGLLAVMHAYMLVHDMRSPATDRWDTLFMGLIVVVTGGLALWAWRIGRRAGPTA